MRTKKHKISFCIVCKNRLYQLEETLLQNIRDNEDYDNLEFILLDYNSEDGMEDWAKENLAEYISNGKLIYYRTIEPKSFNHSHAKNLAFKLATGDIVCNINADHFIGISFASYVNHQYKINNNIVITPISSRFSDRFKHPKDVLGKVCVKKADFLNIKGFDERMRTYGFEDSDFVNRLEMLKIKRVLLNDHQYLKYLPHSDEERFSLEEAYITLDKIFIQYINPSTSNLIFLYHTGKFEMGKIIDNATIGHDSFKSSYMKRQFKFEYTIEGIKWIEGAWKPLNDSDRLFFQTTAREQFYLNPREKYYETILNGVPAFLVDSVSKEELLDFHYFFKNRSLLECNYLKKLIHPNADSFGSAIVYKNFNMNIPLTLNG